MTVMEQTGSIKPTIQEVARLADVSVASASRVFNHWESVLPATRDRILSAARQIGYLPKKKPLRKQEISILMETANALRNPNFAEFVGNVAYHLNKAGFMLNIVPREDPELLKRLCTSGIISLASRMTEEELRRFPAEIPVVVVNCMQKKIPCHVVAVNMDFVQGVALGVNHLIANGHAKIGMITSSPEKHPISFIRYQAFERVMREHGLAVDRALSTITDDLAPVIHERLLMFHGKGGTALMVMGPYQLFQVARAVHTLGLGDAISLIGTANQYVSRFLPPGITTVHQPTDAFCEKTVSVMLRLLDGWRPRRRLLRVHYELVRRGSVRTVEEIPS